MAINQNSSSKDIVSPGHVFPLVGRNGGVLERAGHTEASIDISKLSKLNPCSVICEVMNEDGRMARLDDLIKFSKKHRIKIASIADLIAYRLKNEKLIFKVFSKKVLEKKSQFFQFSVYKNKINDCESFVVSKGKFNRNKSVPVRVLSKKLIKLIYLKIKMLKNIKTLSKYKHFLLIVINNEMNNKRNYETNIP